MTDETDTLTTPPEPDIDPRGLEADPRGLEADPIYGKPLANYPSDRVRLLLISGFIYGAIALVLNLAFAGVEPQTASIFVIGGMALSALGMGWFVLHLWNREVILYERGFSYREGSRDVFFSYGDIDRIEVRAERIAYFGGLLRRTLHEMKLHTIHDEDLTLNRIYRRTDELILRLERMVTQTRLPIVQSKLNSGEQIEFAPGFHLEAGGLNVEQDLLPWADFSGHRIGDGQLHLLTNGDSVWRSIPLKPLYNAALLITLLERYKA